MDISLKKYKKYPFNNFFVLYYLPSSYLKKSRKPEPATIPPPTWKLIYVYNYILYYIMFFLNSVYFILSP